MCDRIIIEIPANTITDIMKSLDECKSSNEELWTEISNLKEDISHINKDLQKIKTHQNKKRFIFF